MKLEIDTIKIELTKDEAQKLKAEVVEILNSNPVIDNIETREKSPKVNELISVLGADLEKLPF